MDISDVGVRHAVAFTGLKITHSIELSPSTIQIAKEIRYCVIAAVLGFTAVSITRTILSSKIMKK